MITQFSILRFSPDPEEVEFVNVAIWLSTGQMVYDAGFHKLKCIAPGYDTSIVEFYLDDLRAQLQRIEPARVAATVAANSSQFTATPPRSLFAEPTDDMIKTLEHRYLRKYTIRDRVREEATERIESRLNDLLFGRIHLPQQNVLRRAAPEAFLGGDALRQLGTNGFHIARVINGPKALMLVDGVNLQLRNRDHIEKRARDIEYAYHRMGQLKDAIRRHEGRQCKRATVIFGAEATRDEPRLDFLVSSLKQHSDYIVQPDVPSREFVNDAFTASSGLFT